VVAPKHHQQPPQDGELRCVAFLVFSIFQCAVRIRKSFLGVKLSCCARCIHSTL
jgi:hypothetical protein